MDNRNFIIAMVLSVVVMFVWSEFFAPKPDPAVAKAQLAKEREEKEAVPATAAKPTEQNGQVSASAATLGRSHPEQKGSISNDSLELDYTSVGGKITKSLIIKDKYRSKNVDLSVGLSKDATFPEMSSVFEKEPDYEVEKKDGNSVVFKYENGGITERKSIVLQENFNIKITKSVTNGSEKILEWIPSVSFNSQYANEDILSSYNKRFNIVAQNGGGDFEELKNNDDIKDFFALDNRVNWIGINYGYFIFTVLTPENRLNALANIDSSKNSSSFTAFGEKILIKPGETAKRDFSIYYGAKEREILKKEAAGLEKTITFGWTSFLAEPLLLALNFFYKFLGNYGLAIILLTIFVRLLLWPLSNVSYKSMSKMKELQPKLKDLQEKYKNDTETLNKETVLLYQKEGINPLGGCLPMFIQMPVYIALYYMIQNAVELYNAPFLPFWLTDLSEKDPFYIIPVSLGILMFLQTKFSPQAGDNKQAKIMMYVMPLIFTWISLVLPSGMTLYWLVNTLLGIAQQFYVNRRYSQ